MQKKACQSLRDGSLRAALALKALATKICGLSSTPETQLKRLFNFLIFSQKFIHRLQKKHLKKAIRIPNARFCWRSYGYRFPGRRHLEHSRTLECRVVVHVCWNTAPVVCDRLASPPNWMENSISIGFYPFVKSKKLSLRWTKYFVHSFWGTQLHGVSLVPSTAGENAWSRTFAPVIGDNIGTSFVGIQRAIHATPIANGKNVHLLLA